MAPAFQLVIPSLRTRRALPKRGICRAPRHAIRRTYCCTEAPRKTDSFPKPGELVLTPGRWADEDGAGIVENVRFVEARGTHVVDVIELQRVANDLFARVSSRAGKSSSKWYDVKDVRAIQTEYISSQDAYRIPDARDGYAEVQPLDAEARAAADAEYVELKQYMLKVTAAFGVVGTACATGIFGVDIGRAFAYGATASLAYLFMLQSSVDAVGDENSFFKKVLSLRFLVPAIPFLLLSREAAVSGASVAALRNSIPKGEVAALLLGLLSYKVPVLVKTGGEFVDGLAEIQPGTSGMLGTAAGLTARSIQRRRGDASGDASEAADIPNLPVIIFAGPSGAGKSTIMSMLEAEYGSKIGYSVSYTTRDPREGEVDGADYFFVNEETFKRMISNNEFIEHAEVHGRFYGTSFAAVQSVLASNRACILDLDVQGIESVRQKQDLQWEPRLIWVAPPSMDALRERLVNRGSETEASLKVRLDTAMKEMSFAATNSIFDLTVINEDVDEAYAEVEGFIGPLISEAGSNE